MIDITKQLDNFEGTEKELKTIAQDVYEICSQGCNENFHDNAKSMLSCDYDYLTPDQYHEVLYVLIEELIKRDTEGCSHFDGSICLNAQCGNYGHYCDYPLECDYYEGGL